MKPVWFAVTASLCLGFVPAAGAAPIQSFEVVDATTGCFIGWCDASSEPLAPVSTSDALAFDIPTDADALPAFTSGATSNTMSEDTLPFSLPAGFPMTTDGPLDSALPAATVPSPVAAGDGLDWLDVADVLETLPLPGSSLSLGIVDEAVVALISLAEMAVTADAVQESGQPSAQQIPEPASVLLLAMGLLGTAWRARHGRR